MRRVEAAGWRRTATLVLLWLVLAGLAALVVLAVTDRLDAGQVGISAFFVATVSLRLLSMGRDRRLRRESRARSAFLYDDDWG